MLDLEEVEIGQLLVLVMAEGACHRSLLLVEACIIVLLLLFWMVDYYYDFIPFKELSDSFIVSIHPQVVITAAIHPMFQAVITV